MTPSNDLLPAGAWREIAKLWSDLGRYPTNAPDEALQCLLERVRLLLDADSSNGVLATRSEMNTRRDPDPLHGWRAAEVIFNQSTMDEEAIARARAWLSDMTNTRYNEVIQADTRDAGTPRTHLREDVIGDRAWEDSAIGEFFELFGIRDRMVSAYPLSEVVEVFVVVDRTGENTTPFDARDRALLHTTLMGAGVLLWRLAMSYGLLRSHASLTPRERETLMYLLHSKSEKEIAMAMGLKASSAHQNVVSVYRKLGVNSRAELMARWMSPPAALIQHERERLGAI